MPGDEQLGDAAYRNSLVSQYERKRQLADRARQQGEYESASSLYSRCADLLEEVADLETSERLATERRSLAENLQAASRKLSNRATDGRAEDTGTGRDTENIPEPSDTGEQTRADHQRGEEATDASEYLDDSPDTDFGDVGGMSELKQTLTDSVIDPLQRPELYEKYDLGVVNGILLYGPPGTGKTYITEALAGELGYNFIDVTPSDLTSALVGEAADNVANLFEVARGNQPCMVFIDEIDAVAGSRSDGAQKTQSERQMVNQLLEELTEIQDEDVVVVGATNLLEEVDDAIRRSGRFDERIEVPPPDATAREAILRVHMRNRPVLTDSIDWETVRECTDGYSASDMELIATTAARQALRDARDEEGIQPVTQQHVETAIEETDSSLEHWE
jgi:transitional endoplasmic reticulum ATPase